MLGPRRNVRHFVPDYIASHLRRQTPLFILFFRFFCFPVYTALWKYPNLPSGIDKAHADPTPHGAVFVWIRVASKIYKILKLLVGCFGRDSVLTKFSILRSRYKIWNFTNYCRNLPDWLSAPLGLLAIILIGGPLCAGFPIGVSYPHFYQADPALVEAVEGSYPEKEKHESHFYIEPVSSKTLLLYTEFSANFEKKVPGQKKTILKEFMCYILLSFTSLSVS